MRTAVSRTPGAERQVSALELFFDLVYVFAIGQLSHHLFAHVDLRTGAETLVLALAVFYAWYMTAWGANWLEPDRLPVRALLVGLMFASLLMSVAMWGRAQGEHFVNVLIWELLAGVFWVAGAFADEDARLALWGLAVVVGYTGAATLHWLPGRGRAVDLGHTSSCSGRPC
jgi:low temperature requirement protein LtrA